MRQRALVVAVVAATAWLAVAPPGAADPAVLVEPPVRGAIYVGNADEEFGGVVDVLAPGQVPHGFPTSVDEDDGLAAGDLVGDIGEEVVVVGDDENRLDIHDAATGAIVGGFDPTFNSEEDGIAVADVRGDAKAEIVIADESSSRVRVYTPTGEQISSFGDTGFDSGDRLIAGDVTGDGVAEILIVNDEDAGRVTVYNAGGTLLRRISTNYQSDDSAAVAELTGDLAGEVVVANADADGRLDIHDASTGEIIRTEDSAFDSDDKMAAGNVNDAGTDEVVVANTEQSGRVDIHDLDGSGNSVTNLDSGYDGDDRFTVGLVPASDLDGDRIPDRVELNGITGPGNVELLPRTSPCRETIHVQIDYMTGEDGKFVPNRTELDRVEAAFDSAPRPGVADCPYPGADTKDGIELHIDVDGTLPAQATVGTDEEFNALKAANFPAVLSPFVHYNPWVDKIRLPDGQEPGGRCCYGAERKDFLGLVPRSVTFQTVTMMHELGHALGLGHGGDDEIDFKPNYLSVMNYQHSSDGLLDDTIRDTAGAPVPQYDFSDTDLPDLDESELFEAQGIGSSETILIKWHDKTGVQRPAERADGPLDWSGDNHDCVDGDKDDRLPVNLNADDNGRCVRPGANDKLDTAANPDDVPRDEHLFAGPNFRCDTQATGDDRQVADVGSKPKLTGHDDWENIHFGGQVGGANTPELTLAEQDEITAAWDRDLYPDRTVGLGAPPAGERAESTAVAEDATRIYLTRYTRTISDPPVSDQPGELVVLSKTTLQVLRRVPVGYQPRSVAVNPVTKRIYVVNRGQQSYSLSVIDGTTLVPVTEVPLGGTPIDVAVNSRTNRVYVSNSPQEVIHVIDGVTSQKLPPIPVGPGPQGLAVDETTNRVFVALNNRSYQPHVNALGVVAPDGAVSKVVIPGVTQPSDVTVDAANGRAFVANLGGGGVPPSVMSFDTGSLAPLGSANLTGSARGIAVNGHAHQVFVATDAGVHVVHDGSLAPLRKMPAGFGPFAVATPTGSGRQLYVANLTGELVRLSYSGGTG